MTVSLASYVRPCPREACFIMEFWRPTMDIHLPAVFVWPFDAGLCHSAAKRSFFYSISQARWDVLWPGPCSDGESRASRWWTVGELHTPTRCGSRCSPLRTAEGVPLPRLRRLPIPCAAYTPMWRRRDGSSQFPCPATHSLLQNSLR